MAHIFAKKSLGQNFLKSQGALRMIVEATRANAQDTVLEVGPGKGALTTKLLETGARVIAIEKDDRLIEHLHVTFTDKIATQQLTLIHGDVLTIDLEKIGLPESYILAANLPYYITGSALRLFLSGLKQPKRAILLLQKEVAKRIVAADGKESILSLSVKIYGEPKYIETVKAKYFSPVPKVDSAIIAIENISREKLAHTSEDSFFTVVKQAFAHKRKMLAGNLSHLYNPENISNALQEAGIHKNARAEDVPLPSWIILSQKLGAETRH